VETLIRIFRHFREYFVLVLFAGISFFLISRSDSTLVHLIRTVSLAATGSLYSLAENLNPSYILRGKDQAMRNANIRLMEEIMELRQLKYENTRLRKLLEFRASAPSTLVPAEVIGQRRTAFTNYLTISTGKSEGVSPGMPVLLENGLVGKVQYASNTYSIVQTLFNRDFRVSAIVKRSRVKGIIRWEKGDYLLLSNVLKTADVAIGDTITTSSFSTIFPPDIFIGTVVSVGTGPTGVFNRITVKPGMNLGTLEWVFVRRSLPNSERKDLEDLLETQAL